MSPTTCSTAVCGRVLGCTGTVVEQRCTQGGGMGSTHEPVNLVNLVNSGQFWSNLVQSGHTLSFSYSRGLVS